MRGDWKYPELWTPSCVAAWCPSQGCTWDTLRDYSGRGNHGVLTSMDPGTDWVPSLGHLALDLDDVNDHILLPSTAVVLTAGQPYSVSWWEYINASVNLYPSRFCLDVAGSTDYWLCLRPSEAASADYKRIVWGKSPAGFTETHRASTAPTTAASVGTWKHFCITGSDPVSIDETTQKLYIDGVSYALIGGGSFGTIAVNRIGYDGADSGAECKMDDIRVYQRQLTETEIKLLGSRRGIAYDRETRRRVYIAVTANRRRQALSAI